MGALKWPFLCHMGCLPILNINLLCTHQRVLSVLFSDCDRVYTYLLQPPSQTQKTSDPTARWAENWLWTSAISLSYSSVSLTQTFLKGESATPHMWESFRSFMHLLKRFRLFASSFLNSQQDKERINVFNCHRQSWIDGKSENNEQMRCWNS